MDESPAASTPEPEVSAGASESNPGGTRQVNEVSRWRYVLLWPLYWLARAWSATLRFHITDEERAWLGYNEGPTITLVWHNRLFVGAEVWRRFRRHIKTVGLVSASRDGAWLSVVLKLQGMGAVRGSSSWRGARAARELIAAGQTGADIGITPDGPRGPCYDIKPGALVVARLTQRPLLLISARFTKAVRLRSWDGFYLPMPFSVVEVRSRLLPGYANQEGDDYKAAAETLRQQFMEITEDE